MGQGTSRWVEFYGGPYDGTMVEMPKAYAPDDTTTGLIVSASREKQPDGSTVYGPPSGVYVPAGWAVDDLAVIRMDWHPI
jgi:hypothetical protein